MIPSRSFNTSTPQPRAEGRSRNPNAMGEDYKVEQKHGKSRVRVARVWRPSSPSAADVAVEWNVNISLLSDCLPAYTSADNSAIVATDTIKNTVYVKAQECTQPVPVETFAIILAKHFVTVYPQVTGAIVGVVEKPWERVVVDGKFHVHGFKLGSERRTADVTLEKCGALSVTSGVEGLALLKTTQSGFEGFVRDRYTVLPETRERMLATEVTASWRYGFEALSQIPAEPFCFTDKYQNVKKLLVETFFGAPDVGVYSPSVQNTLYLMAKAVLNRFLEISSIRLIQPNLHFLPVNISGKDNPNIVKFADDVYLPTDEPHGTIEATVTRSRSKM